MNNVVLIVKHELADVWFVNELYVPCEQFTKCVDASGQKLPAGHTKHEFADVWFVNVLYVPALQFTNVGDATGQ